MPMRVVRFTAREIREHLLQLLIVLVILNGVLGGVLTYRTFFLANRIVENTQATCATGNEARAQVRILTLTVRRLIDVSLAIPAERTLTTKELVARARLITIFTRASHALTRRLPALMPRDCSRSAVTSARVEPAG